jgi:hypothetical protein
MKFLRNWRKIDVFKIMFRKMINFCWIWQFFGFLGKFIVIFLIFDFFIVRFFGILGYLVSFLAFWNFFDRVFFGKREFQGISQQSIVNSKVFHNNRSWIPKMADFKFQCFAIISYPDFCYSTLCHFDRRVKNENQRSTL